METVAKRFLFDNYFDTNEKGVTVARDFTGEDMEQARLEGFEEGKTRGREEAQASINQQVADALANASRSFQALQQGMEGLKQDVEIDALRTVSMIVGKIVPYYAGKHGLEEVEALVHECLAAAYDEPRVVVRAHGSILGPLTDHLDQVTTSSGFNGNVVALEDPSLSPGDCRVEWADGGAERDVERVWESIKTALARFTGESSPLPSEPLGEEKPAGEKVQ
jgi:flagellar assembly protein FliH